MFKFLKESIKEFDHVVWPTQAETKKYFSFVGTFIAVFAIFLFIVGSLFSAGIFSAREATTSLRPAPQLPVNNTTNTGSLPDFQLNDFQTTSGESSAKPTSVTSSETAPVLPSAK